MKVNNVIQINEIGDPVIVAVVLGVAMLLILIVSLLIYSSKPPKSNV